MMMEKDIFGYLSIVAAVGVTLPYLWKTHQGKIRPHIFTWVVWALSTAIAASARGAAHAGPGAWGQWAGASSCVVVALFTFYKGDHNITRSDIIAFVGALSAIPAWILTRNPLTAILIVTVIDALAYYPTFRKSYRQPHHEAVFNYVAANIIHLLSLCATVEYSLTTLLFPSVLFMMNSSLIIFILLRRRQVAVDSYN